MMVSDQFRQNPYDQASYVNTSRASVEGSVRDRQRQIVTSLAQCSYIDTTQQLSVDRDLKPILTKRMQEANDAQRVLSAELTGFDSLGGSGQCSLRYGPDTKPSGYHSVRRKQKTLSQTVDEKPDFRYDHTKHISFCKEGYEP
jgi:hypothetical protein